MLISLASVTHPSLRMRILAWPGLGYRMTVTRLVSARHAHGSWQGVLFSYCCVRQSIPQKDICQACRNENPDPWNAG